MTPNERRRRIAIILDGYDEALAALRQSRGALAERFAAQEAALASALEANRAALRLLTEDEASE